MTDRKILIENIIECYLTQNNLTETEANEIVSLRKDLKAINYMRCSLQLLCVNKGDDNGITKGYEYKCINQNKSHYRIVDNYGYEGWFAKEHFKELI